MLNDDRHIRLEHRGVVGVAWDGRWILKIVESQMQRSLRSYRYAIRSYGLPIREEDGNANVCILVAGVEDAGRFMRDKGRL